MSGALALLMLFIVGGAATISIALADLDTWRDKR